MQTARVGWREKQRQPLHGHCSGHGQHKSSSTTTAALLAPRCTHREARGQRCTASALPRQWQGPCSRRRRPRRHRRWRHPPGSTAGRAPLLRSDELLRAVWGRRKGLGRTGAFGLAEPGAGRGAGELSSKLRQSITGSGCSELCDRTASWLPCCSVLGGVAGGRCRSDRCCPPVSPDQACPDKYKWSS